MSLIRHNNNNRLKVSYNDIYICIGNVYNAFLTLTMIQTYLTQQNDNGSF